MDKWVWDGYTWVPYDPVKHKGRPTSDYGWQRDPQDGTIPFYGNDVAATLMQQAFPGAVSDQAFASMFLTPERQKAIKEALARLTPEQMQKWMTTLQGRMQAMSDRNFGEQAADARGMGSEQGMQDAQMLKGMGFDPSHQASAILKAHNATLGQIAKLNAQRNSTLLDNMPMDMDNPFMLDKQKIDLINGNITSPSLNNVTSFIPGLEAQRQNGSFLNNLLNAGLNYFSGGGSLGKLFKSGGGGAPKGSPWLGVGGKGL